jgi:malate dehydrogenase (quinone)
MAGKIKKMIPSHGQDLNDNPALSDEIKKMLLLQLK